MPFTAPRCRRCHEVPSLVVGLPVTIDFTATAVATITTDMSEANDGYAVLCRCTSAPEPVPADLSDDDAATLHAWVTQLGWRTEPSLDYTLQEG